MKSQPQWIAALLRLLVDDAAFNAASLAVTYDARDCFGAQTGFSPIKQHAPQSRWEGPRKWQRLRCRRSLLDRETAAVAV